MATESGYSNEKKWGRPQHKTIHSLGSSRYGQHVVSKSLAEKNAIAVPIEAVTLSTDSTKIMLEISGHQARKGDIVRFISGANVGAELDVVAVTDANHLVVFNTLDIQPAVADTVKVMFYVTSKSDAEGNVNFSPGPTQFVQDGSATQVIEDSATPANNKGLPSQLMIYKDGVQYPVTKDTADASGTLAVPVEIVGVDGTNINITAGDINVQLTDQGVNADVVRIGDGTTQLEMTLTGEAKVHDAEAVTALESIDAKTPALVGGNVPVDTGFVQPLTDTELRANPVPVSGTVSTGGLTDAELRATPVPVSGPLTDAQLRATAVPVSGPLTDTQLRAAAVDIASNQLPTTLGQKTAPNSLSVVLASGTSITATVTGGATEAKQDTQITELTAIKNKDFATQATLASVLTELEKKADLTETQPVSLASLPVMVPSFQEILNLTTAVQTFVAPANAKWCKVMTDDDNTGNIRVKLGGVATIASGMRFQPGRSEDFQAVGDISVIAESGTDNKIQVIFGV